MNSQPFVTKSDYLYENLKSDILNGKLHPGERLIVADIAQEYSMSPMPVREAMRRLQQEGLLEITPHIGAKVSNIDHDEFREIMEIRVELESMAVRLAAVNMNDSDKEKLVRLDEMMEEAVKEDDAKRFSKLNEEFHSTLYAASGNHYLDNLINELWHKTERTKSIFERYPKRMAESCEEHKAVTECILKGDQEGAYKAYRKHKIEGFSIVFDLLERE